MRCVCTWKQVLLSQPVINNYFQRCFYGALISESRLQPLPKMLVRVALTAVQAPLLPLIALFPPLASMRPTIRN